MPLQEQLLADDLVRVIKAGRYVVLAAIVGFGLLGVVYVLLSDPIYRAEVKLVSTEEGIGLGGLASAVGGLVGMAGLRAGGSGLAMESMSVLKSRSLVAQMIEEKQLLPILFPDDWDASKSTWIESDQEDQPDLRTGVDKFVRSVRSVSEDRVSGEVTVSVDWTDPNLAAEWANDIAKRVNGTMKHRTLERTLVNIDYLQKEIEKAALVETRAASASLLEQELQKLLLVRNSDEPAFRVVDPAVAPRKPIRPRPVLTVFAAMFGGLLLSVLLLVFRTFLGRTRGAK